MKKIYTFTLLLIVSLNGVLAQGSDIEKYRRSSIYSVLISQAGQKFATEIEEVFRAMPTPDKYNNHDLGVKVVLAQSPKTQKSEVDAFLESNNIASRLVARWFDRNILTGECDMELIKERGLYNANDFDKAIADQSIRGRAMLEDAGEELIAQTFVLMNEISYVDKSNAAKGVGAGLKILAAVASIATGSDFSDLGDSMAKLAETLKGFKVKITTHLYQLEWSEEVAMNFYTKWYADIVDESRYLDFESNRSCFKLKYLGQQDNKASEVSFIGVNLDSPDAMVRKACQRSLDENVAMLQKSFDVFKVRVPILSVDPIKADIGLKEGITKDSRFEVLQAVLKDDRVTYERVGVVVPKKNLIRDNRYMAREEGADNSELDFTTFEKVSGRDLYPGMLLREIK